MCWDVVSLKPHWFSSKLLSQLKDFAVSPKASYFYGKLLSIFACYWAFLHVTEHLSIWNWYLSLYREACAACLQWPVAHGENSVVLMMILWQHWRCQLCCVIQSCASIQLNWFLAPNFSLCKLILHRAFLCLVYDLKFAFFTVICTQKLQWLLVLKSNKRHIRTYVESDSFHISQRLMWTSEHFHMFVDSFDFQCERNSIALVHVAYVLAH